MGMQVFRVPSDCAGIINPRCSLDPNHSDGVQSLCLNGMSLFSGGRDMAIMKWDLTDPPQLRQVLCRRHCFCREEDTFLLLICSSVSSITKTFWMNFASNVTVIQLFTALNSL